VQLIDHVSITVSDLRKAQPFYEAVMRSLDAEIVYAEAAAIGFGERNGPGNAAHSYLSIFESSAAQADPRRHYCFKANSETQVRDFYRAALANGGQDAGPPGLRDYHSSYFAAFVLDPHGNKLEAVYHGAEPLSGAQER
jgi:catechol 2,3-dioxygenase-like lactoylglutathione lyase family enzyme